jgi:hypothetical protein
MESKCTICQAYGDELNNIEPQASGKPRQNRFLIPHDLSVYRSGQHKGLVALCGWCGYDFDSEYTRDLIESMPSLCPGCTRNN